MRRLILLSLLLLVLVACQNTPATPAPLDLPTASPVAAQPTAPTYALQSTEPLAAEAAGLPIRLAIPVLDLTIPIESMGWQVTQVEGERRAIWEVPQNSAGWHLNSARPGTAGNLVLSGHHLLGAAVFAPLARGEVTVGTQLLITDDQGHTFLYEVREVAPPIPAIGGTQAEQQQAETYLAPTSMAVLTLVTGWPDFSDTHYLFIRANFLGMLQ